MGLVSQVDYAARAGGGRAMLLGLYGAGIRPHTSRSCPSQQSGAQTNSVHGPEFAVSGLGSRAYT